MKLRRAWPLRGIQINDRAFFMPSYSFTCTSKVRAEWMGNVVTWTDHLYHGKTVLGVQPAADERKTGNIFF